MPSHSQKQHDFFEQCLYGDFDHSRPKLAKFVARDFLEADKKEGLWQPKFTGSPKVEKLTWDHRKEYVIFNNKLAEVDKSVTEIYYPALKEKLNKLSAEHFVFIAICGGVVIGSIEFTIPMDKDIAKIMTLNKFGEGAPDSYEPLLKKVLTLVRSKKKPKLQVTLSPDNTDLVKFYKDHGFKVEHTAAAHVQLTYEATPVKESSFFGRW